MIEHLIINSLVIFGIHAITRQNMLLSYFYRSFAAGLAYCLLKLYKNDVAKSENLTATLLKPIFDCPPCMASVWGIPFVLMHPINIWSVAYLFALCGINYIVMKLINR